MKFIIISGHRKSGTTMVHNLFDNHPHLNIYPVDINLLYAFWPYYTDKLDPKDFKSRIDHVINKSTFPIHGKFISSKCSSFNSTDFLKNLWRHNSPEELVTPEKIITSIANSWCDLCGLDPGLPFLIKETSQTIHANIMRRNGLDIKFINLIRDPRDNYAAIKSGVGKYYSQMGEGEKESLASLLNRSRMDLLISMQLKEQKVNWSKSIKFEELVISPKTIMKELANFCNIQYVDSLIKPTIAGEKEKGNSYEGLKFEGISNIHVNKWKERISTFEAGVIEFWMRDVMKYWEYETEIDINDASNSFSDFYNWYNSKYFYYDSYTMKKPN